MELFSRVRLGALVSVLLMSPALPRAQPLWVNQEQNLALEVFKPDFDGPDNTSFMTATWFLTFRWPVASRVTFVSDVPFVHSKSDFRRHANDRLGNLYLGFEFHKAGFPLSTELGVRLPVVDRDDFATFIGFFSDIDRFEAFIADNLTVMGFVNFRRNEPGEVGLRLRLGSSILFNTQDKVDPDMFVLFSAQAVEQVGRAEFLGGVTGRVRLTRDRVLGQRGFLQLGLAASLDLGAVRPGLHIKFPLESDLLEIIDFVAAANLGVRLR